MGISGEVWPCCEFGQGDHADAGSKIGVIALDLCGDGDRQASRNRSRLKCREETLAGAHRSSPSMKSWARASLTSERNCSKSTLGNPLAVALACAQGDKPLPASDQAQR